MGWFVEWRDLGVYGPGIRGRCSDWCADGVVERFSDDMFMSMCGESRVIGYNTPKLDAAERLLARARIGQRRLLDDLAPLDGESE